MNGVKLIWSLLSLTPDEWLIQNRIDAGSGTDGAGLYAYRDPFEWEMTDDIGKIIKQRLGYQALVRYQYMCGLSTLKEFKAHVKQLTLTLFVIRQRTFQVLETALGRSTVREVYSLPISRFPEKYVYIGIQNTNHGSSYRIGKREADVLKDRPSVVLKLPLNHKGGPKYAFGSRWARTDYEQESNFDLVYKQDYQFYYGIESTFPRDPQGYYDRCMELIAGEVRVYDTCGRHMWSLWEYADTFRKGYEDFMDQEMFEEMMRLEHPILWYRDEDELI